MKTPGFLLFGMLILASCGTSDNGNKEELNPTQKSNKILLRFKPENNTKSSVTYTFKVDNKKSGDDPEFTVYANTLIEDNSNNKIKVQLQYDSILMKGTIKGKEYSLKANSSSDDIEDDAKMVTDPVFSLLGKRFNFEFDEQFRKTSEVINSEDTKLTSGESKIQFLIRFPEKEVGVKDSWEDELELKVGGIKVNKVTYTIVSISETEAVISINGKLKSDNEKFGKTFAIDGNLTGEAHIDIKTGWQTNTTLNLDFKLTMDGNEIPMTQTIQWLSK